MINFSDDFDAFRVAASNEIARHLDELEPRFSPALGLPEERAYQAARYAFDAGGKRLRGILIMCGSALADPNGQCSADAMTAAVSVELMHTYSLIHDDLPAMDDDTLRRGKPTTHIAYDDATAILAGDGLQALALQLLAQGLHQTDPVDALALVADLTQAVGFGGMVGGQMLDIIAETTSTPFDLDTTKRLQAKKTGALIRYAAKAGAVMHGERGELLSQLERYGARIGLAFQIVDDLLDLRGDSAVVGKAVGKDDDKATFIDLLGEQGARDEVQRLTMDALQITQFLQEHANIFAQQAAAEQLSNIAQFIATRHH